MKIVNFALLAGVAGLLAACGGSSVVEPSDLNDQRVFSRSDAIIRQVLGSLRPPFIRVSWRKVFVQVIERTAECFPMPVCIFFRCHEPPPSFKLVR